MKTSTIKYVGIGIGLLLLPPILNYLLQMPTPVELSIIENSSCGGAPATWLVFWGSYLAACGSFIMALVSYLQNKKIREQNTARIEYELTIKQYEELERFVLEAEKIFSVSALELLCNILINEGSKSQHFLKQYYDYLADMNHSSSMALRLLKEKSSIHEQYFDALTELYSRSTKMSKMLYNLDKDPKAIENQAFLTNGKPDYYKAFEYAQKSLINVGVDDIHSIGFKCLREEWKNVQEKLNKTK